MAGFANAAEREGFEVVALSGSPDESYRVQGISAVPRRDMGAVQRAIDNCDALVFPGGSIFQDVTSVRSVYYYAKLISMAKKSKKKVVLVGQGIGPLSTFFGKRIAAKALGAADFIGVRDPQALNSLRALNVRTPAKVTADSAFLLPFPTLLEDAENFQVGKMRTVAISPRPIAKGFDVTGVIGDFCKMLFQSGTMPVLISMDRNEDDPLIQQISDRQGGKIPDLRKIESPQEIQRRLARVECVVAMRLHAGILATTVNVPALMLNYDPKVAAFARLIDIGSAVNLEGLTAARLFDAYTSFQRDRDRNAKIVEKKNLEMRNLALQNLQIVIDTLGAPSKVSS